MRFIAPTSRNACVPSRNATCWNPSVQISFKAVVAAGKTWRVEECFHDSWARMAEGCLGRTAATTQDASPRADGTRGAVRADAADNRSAMLSAGGMAASRALKEAFGGL